MKTITRRSLLLGGLVAGTGVAGAALAAAGRRFGLIPPDWRNIYGPGETLSYAAHRLFGRNALAREFPRSMISAKPFANGISKPTEAFTRHHAENFVNWRLDVDGHVARKTSLSRADLRAMERRSQITEVVCEEGWSYVAEWIGTPLADILRAAGITPQARYVAYFSIDSAWWESIDMADALHPQTLLAYAMNDHDLPPAFGGPLRLRVPRQLGYKSVKYINRLAVTDSLEKFGKGLGSASPEGGYAWYAGI